MRARAWAVAISLVGAGSYSQPFDNLGTEYKAKIGSPGGGVLIDAGRGRVGIELGLLYLNRKSESPTGTAGTTVTVSSNLLEGSALLRLWPVWWFSLGGGGYYAKYRGPLETTTTTSAGTSVSRAAYPQSQRSDHDYGAVASASALLPLGSRLRFLVDGRYTFGLLNNTLQPQSSLKFRDFLALAGFQLAF